MEQIDFDMKETLQFIGKENSIPKNLTLGQRLKQARESKRISIDDLADQLRINKSIIESIDADADLNKKNLVFIRGYIRAYARAVQIPMLEIDDFFKQLNVDEKVKDGGSARLRIDVSPSYTKWVRLVTYLIITLLVVLVLIWRYLHHGENEIQFVQSSSPVVPVVTKVQMHQLSSTDVQMRRP